MLIDGHWRRVRVRKTKLLAVSFVMNFMLQKILHKNLRIFGVTHAVHHTDTA